MKTISIVLLAMLAPTLASAQVPQRELDAADSIAARCRSSLPKCRELMRGLVETTYATISSYRASLDSWRDSVRKAFHLYHDAVETDFAANAEQIANLQRLVALDDSILRRALVRLRQETVRRQWADLRAAYQSYMTRVPSNPDEGAAAMVGMCVLTGAC